MKFMCKLSKNTYEFTSAFDIEQMKKHPDYEVVADGEPTAEELQASEDSTEGAKPVKSKKSS